MMLFVSIAALLIVVALAWVLWPLLRAQPRAQVSTRQANLSVFRDQLSELERDLKLGVLDQSQFSAARAELERHVLEDAGEQASSEPAPAARRSPRLTAAVIGLCVPILAGLLYWRLGNPDAMHPMAHAVDPASLTVEQFADMTDKLAQRMAANPDDPTGWLMLGRAYKALQRYPEAIGALTEADKRRPDDVDILVELAEAQALSHDRRLENEPRRLLERALQLDPNNERALTLAGAAAYARRDYKAAIVYWERLRARVPADSELGQALAGALERARARAGERPAASRPAPAGAHPEAIRGEVRLADTLKHKAQADDTVFVFVRATEGPRMPLAVLTTKVKNLPARFQLDDSQAMSPAMKLSGFERVIVSARVSKSGAATPQPGDLQGASGIVAPGAAGLVVTIDSIVQ